MIDRMLYNGKIITLNRRQPHATAIALRGERIVAIGADAAIMHLSNAETIVENLDGQTVIPGLTDAHIHWEWLSRAMQAVDLFEVPSLDVARQRIKARVHTLEPGAWLTGRGWAQDAWEGGRFPTAADLDDISPQNPAYFQAKSGHAAWVNSAALRACGITADTPDPDGGQIVRDADGQPTGLLLETAMEAVAAQVPEPTPDELADFMLEAQDAALAAGLTGIHDYDNPSCLRALQILRERGQLGLRVVKQINRQWLQPTIEAGIRSGFGDDWLRIGALKLFADGALGPRTAAMIAPYDDDPDNTGIMVLDKEIMHAHASQASLHGLPTTIHAIGDRAVHDVLDVFAAVRQEEAARHITPDQRRHRIEHVQIIHPDDHTRLADLQLIASMQPIHATSDWRVAERAWGQRVPWSYNARLQADLGVVLAFGSDSPVEPFEPLRGIHAAVTRQRPDGTPPGGWLPHLRLTLDETLRAFTQGPAYAAGLEDRLGMLAPGYLADLVVLDRHITSVPPEDLLQVQIVATMVGGQWRSGGIG